MEQLGPHYHPPVYLTICIVSLTIMKMPIFCRLLLVPAALALTVPRRMSSRRVVHSQSSLPSPSALSIGGQGWDNDNFLNSLGGDEDDLNRANDDYYSMSKYGRPEDSEPDIPVPNVPADPDSLPTQDISGAALTEEMKQKAKNSHTPEEEASQGGQMFRKLLERAQQQPSRNIPPPMYTPPPPPPQVMQQPVQPQIQPPPMQPPADFNNLSVEQQARLFREMMAQQPQPQPSQQTQQPNPYAPNPYTPPPGGAYPPPPGQPPKGSYLGPGIAPDGRKIGRNKDADAIVNTADLYFAQLKRDSTTRNYARYAGDDDKANAVFHDPSIEQIKMHVNPYLIEQAEKEKEMYTTVPEEMIIFHDYDEEPKQPKNFAGISYKEKLAQLKARKQGLPVPPTQREIQAKLAANEERRRILEVGETPPAIPAVPEPYGGVESVPQQQEEETTGSMPPQMMDTEPIQKVAQQTFQPPMHQTPEQPRPTLNSDNVTTGDTRADIRSLMGLILKHRGGPGFGAGRLQGEEAARLEALAQAIPQVLRQEESQVKTGVPPSDPSVSDPSNLDSMIACIEGAITTYRNAPPELQGSVLVTLRAALLSALDTLAQEIENEAPTAPSSSLSMTETPVSPVTLTPEQTERVFSMNACIEGAITMYNNSPAQLRSSILVTLNAALMSAVTTFNEIMAGVGEAASAVDSQTIPESPEYSGNDPNSLMLQEIYEKIKAAGGDGPMGLRTDISEEEAQDLQDSLTDMRTLLVDELHSGIPEESNEAQVEPQLDAVPDEETPNTASSTASTYRKMLQRARDEKEASDGFQ
jgi:hypothetical protein